MSIYLDTINIFMRIAMILAGGGELGLRHGRYHRFDEHKYCLSDLFVTMLNALSMERQSFGDSKTNLNEVLLG